MRRTSVKPHYNPAQGAPTDIEAEREGHHCISMRFSSMIKA